MIASPAAILAAARQQAGLSDHELWLAYFGLGGMGSLEEVATILMGKQEPSRYDYDLLAQALNDHFIDQGLDHPVPYWGERD